MRVSQADHSSHEQVNLYRYPVLEGHIGKSFGGHAAHVTNVSYNHEATRNHKVSSVADFFYFPGVYCG
jgi:hypothetical protein